MNKTKICISPMDWGLGHATRCIPLIQALEELNYEIYIGTDGDQEVILKEALPHAHFLPLRGYRIRYTKWGALLPLAIFFQLPKILFSILHEYRWLQKKHKDIRFDLIISDNRYGFFHKKVPSVFMTHQLNFQMPYPWATRLFQKMQYSWFKNFKACWIPDITGPNNLSGILSNPLLKPKIPIWYMGYLSRLTDSKKSNTFKIDKASIVFLGIISGPEPQRSLLENLLWNKGNQLNLKFTIVAGTPNIKEAIQQHKATMYPHLPASKLITEIEKAEYIICRGGYSTLMELIPFGKKIILIPTPGQTEQALLGKLWQEQKWALCYDQSNFKLSTALNEASQFNFLKPIVYPFSSEALETAIKQLTL